VELFEEVRREYEHGVGTVRGVAKKLGVHRRLVRAALVNAVPAARKTAEREQPKLGPVKTFIDGILDEDRRAPRKQRHTAHRIYQRLKAEVSGADVSESTVRRYVGTRKEEMGLASREVFVPQSYQLGEEGQVDWFEAQVRFAGDERKVYFFCMRSMASGAAFHRAYLHATQQAFLEAHELAFAYFGGVFRELRYDNLKSAVKRVLKGSRREETTRFIAFRSHWGFTAGFCTPGKGHEKGGVEGEGGHFRRNHLVPVPEVRDLDHLNEQLLTACRQDESRMIGQRTETAGAILLLETLEMLPLAGEGFDLAEVSFPLVDSKGCVTVRTNQYSTALKPGTSVEAKLQSAYIEVWHDGKCAARHERCYQRRQQIFDLEHYLEPLNRKPGAFAGSTPLAQWRQQGRWTPSHDEFWQNLNRRHGRQNGTRVMIDVLGLGRQHGFNCLEKALKSALAMGCCDAEAVRYLLTASQMDRPPGEPVSVGGLARYDRPMPTVSEYDQLLGSAEVIQ
jgi:transposase